MACKTPDSVYLLPFDILSDKTIVSFLLPSVQGVRELDYWDLKFPAGSWYSAMWCIPAVLVLDENGSPIVGVTRVR